MSKLIAHNNEWNRKYNFTAENGFGMLIESKNGMTFFSWQFPDGKMKYYKCEEAVFEKNFELGEETTVEKIVADTNLKYLRYPVEQ